MAVGPKILHKAQYGLVRDRSIWDNILQTKHPEPRGYMLFLNIE